MSSQRVRRRTIVASAVLLALPVAWLGFPRSPDALAASRESSGGRVWRDGGFALITDVEPALAREALDALADADRLLDGWLGPRRGDEERVIVWSRSNPAAGGPLCRHSYDELGHTGARAFHSGVCGMIHVLEDDRDPALVRRVLLHEAAHQRLASRGAQRPGGAGAWIGEGLATLLETLDADGRVRFDRVERIAVARALHDAGLLVDAQRFASLDRDELEQLPSIDAYYSWRRVVYLRSVPLFHTQAFAWAAFLHERLGPGFSSYVRDALERGSGPDSASRALRLGPGELQPSFEAWLESLDLTSTVGFDPR